MEQELTMEELIALINSQKQNAALVVYTGTERRGEESISCRSSEGDDSYLLLSGGHCGEDEFISE